MPSPLKPTMIPSSQGFSFSLKAKAGKVLAKVIPAFLPGYLSKTLLTAERIG